MIATEDLMTGDWVLYKGQPVMVEEISRPSQKVSLATAHMAAPAVSVNDIEPIPLTDEILRNSGFRKVGEDQWTFEDFGTMILEIRGGFWVRLTNLPISISFVHELQNILKAFRLSIRIKLEQQQQTLFQV